MESIVKTSINRYSLFCPVCGRDVLKQYLQDDEPCVHTVYVYFDDVQNFAHISERREHVQVFDAHGVYIWDDVPIESFQSIQHQLSQSILHLVLDTSRQTIGALSGVMRIGFDFDVVDVWSHH